MSETEIWEERDKENIRGRENLGVILERENWAKKKRIWEREKDRELGRNDAR